MEAPVTGLGARLAAELRARRSGIPDLFETTDVRYEFYRQLARVDSVETLRAFLSHSGFSRVQASTDVDDVVAQILSVVDRRRFEVWSHNFSAAGGLMLILIGIPLTQSSPVLGWSVAALGLLVLLWFGYRAWFRRW